jgi:hypothetical protein
MTNIKIILTLEKWCQMTQFDSHACILVCIFVLSSEGSKGHKLDWGCRSARPRLKAVITHWSAVIMTDSCQEPDTEDQASPSRVRPPPTSSSSCLLRLSSHHFDSFDKMSGKIYFGKYAIEQVQVSRAHSRSSLYRYDFKGLPMGPHTDVIWHHPPEVSNHNEHWNTLSSNKGQAENRHEICTFNVVRLKIRD